MTTLLIDDDPVALDLLALQLAPLGRTDVIRLQHAAEALALLEADRDAVKLVFCDLHMPDIDGVEFMRRLARIGYRGELVVVSGDSRRALQAAHRLASSLQLRILGVVPKPASTERLRQVLEAGAADAAAVPFTAQALAQAIDAQEFVYHYQPKVSLATAAVVGVEVLVRWQHPQLGLVYPDRFIGLAEAHGLLDRLTQLVLAAALRQARRWRDACLDLRMAVNVSMDSLSAPGFADTLARLAADAGVALSSLTLEVTESRLMTGARAPVESLARLRRMGVSLSIDDFGTGRSTPDELRDIPFDEIKLDGSFINGAARDPSLKAAVEATLAMSYPIGMKSVAEGVEERIDWDFLRLRGCDAAQGYFIARPMPADELLAWHAAWEARCEGLVRITPSQFADLAGSPRRPSRVRDPKRLAALHGYRILDTPAEPEFDRIVAEAAAACEAPIALLSLVDSNRQWFKARVGVDVRETTLDRSICAKAIDYDGLFVVPDASVDPRVNANPLVWGEPHISFYAGKPLVGGDGEPIGMLCVLDTVKRPGGLRTEQAQAITGLASQVMSLLDARRQAVAVGDAGRRQAGAG